MFFLRFKPPKYDKEMLKQPSTNQPFPSARFFFKTPLLYLKNYFDSNLFAITWSKYSLQNESQQQPNEVQKPILWVQNIAFAIYNSIDALSDLISFV